ncbi:hypothetical protein [Actinomadura madurae]|uniref:hypothetical protein n=1 Tax=Actinomadura madurae TaxID=1993 RepID=UPI0020D234CF|nr:hypothetical protein [Actinomadura madurae]MCP9954683.1 hypothetical protein [Actinomadura madurae]MCP9971422.1 hypothetical protein [Actinomadura madurae]MCP9983912.1 hypothetical protein [Actinomadura madurae]MCQ0004522.1 hypothetical protein [Actinomadura madurae]MCQ0020145.1 hypothetical protein [Actinomadura madurae]
MTTDPGAGPARPATARELRQARRRAANRRDHFAAKRAAAATAQARVAVAWDQWRALLRDIPVAEAERLAEETAARLAQQIDHMTTLQGDQP